MKAKRVGVGLMLAAGVILGSTQPSSYPSRAASPVGMVAPGNINLGTRPVVHNRDGTISTVRSITVTMDDGRAVLLPTVMPDGRVVGNGEAIAMWQQTGLELGTFDTEEHASAYAVALHDDQARMYESSVRRRAVGG